MKKEDVVRQYTTPIAAPAFVQGPHRFKRREYLNITYRTDGEALAKLVPEPLEIDQPLVRFEVMKMPDTTGYGAYVECGHAAVVRMDREQGEFLLAMYLDNLPAIAAGRELSAFPKKLGSAKLFVDSDTLVGTLDYGALRVATATMGYKPRAPAVSSADRLWWLMADWRRRDELKTSHALPPAELKRQSQLDFIFVHVPSIKGSG